VPGNSTKGSELVVLVYPLSFLYKRITSCDNFHRMSLMMLPVVFLIQLYWPQILSSCMKLFMLLENVTRCFKCINNLKISLSQGMNPTLRSKPFEIFKNTKGKGKYDLKNR
jgi:hypothetical protein